MRSRRTIDSIARMNIGTTILYHADCPDGFGAAYAAWRHFGLKADYLALNHGDVVSESAITNRDVFILDFSFPPAQLAAMAAQANSLTQIDHHASAAEAWGGQLKARTDGCAVFSDPSLPLNVIFDLDKSGTRLAWEHFHPSKPLPIVLQHVEDQDLWRFLLPGTRAFVRALRLLPFDFVVWLALDQACSSPETDRYRDMLKQGEAIDTFFRREVERLASSNLRMTAYLRGEPVDSLQALRHGQDIVAEGDLSWLAIRGTAINANGLFASELGNELALQNGVFGLVWQLGEDGKVSVSLRSCGAFNVANIAMRYGGGGHRNAAGFRIPLKQFLGEILRQN